MTDQSLQDLYAPNSICFGCGPKNSLGLQLKTFPSDEGLAARWTPQAHHAAFSGFASGGIVSVLLDCLGNWTAAYALMQSRGSSSPPGTVTAEYTVRFLKPTPLNTQWELKAHATKVEGDKVSVEGTLGADGATAKMSGLFVAVKETHPAFHRWQ